MILNRNEIYKTSNDVELYITKDIVKDSKAIVLIVTGLAEDSSRYDYVVSKLNSYKYSVYRFDNIGHGKTSIEIDYNEFPTDIDEIVKNIKQENDNKPIFIMGNNMGGITTCSYSVKYPNSVNGIILSFNNDPLVANKVIDRIFMECKKFEYPTLMLHGPNNKILKPDQSKEIFDKIDFKYKKFKVYESKENDILNEFGSNEALIDINNWIRKELRYL